MSKSLVLSLVSRCLAASVVISFVAFCSTQPKRIQLPTSDGTLIPDSTEQSQSDLFDIAKPEEVIDGTPLDEDEFWVKPSPKVRRRKLIQTCILTFGLIFACGEIGLFIWTKSGEDKRETFFHATEVVFLAYLVILSSISIPTTDVPLHWSHVIHLSILSAIGFALYLLAVVLPTGPRLETSDIKLSGVQPILHYSVISLLGISTLIGVIIPRAPKLHFPPELVYQLNTLDLSAPKSRDNVIQEPHASIASFLFFNYVTPVAMLGYYAESLEIRDLPILTARLRSPLIFSQMRDVIRNVRLPGWLGVKLGSGYQLIYQILVANKRAFLSQAAFSVVVAGLYYVPAWFIKQFVHFLELTRGSDQPLDIDIGWGWAYCAGLMISSVTVHLVAAQIWSLSIVKLQIPLKIQLNTMLFAKTLVRKDIVSAGSVQTRAATPTDESVNQPPEGKDGAKDEFSSKAQVHTLMTTDVDRVAQFHLHLYPLIDCPIELAIGIFFLYTLLGSSCFLGLLAAIVLFPVNHQGSKFVVAAQDRLMSARDERIALMNEVLGAIRMLKFMAWERNFEKKTLGIRTKELKYQKQSFLVQVLFSAIFDGTPVV
ncbi:hypothetical protein FRC07_003764 [Ceratobasidium sp. 392]|nr:hypothetical protein FRC07_003764 [Ceratobasidium sp. 392]